MQQSLAESVAAEVRAEMGRQQASQSDVAAIVGLSQQAVSRRIAGRVPFDVTELEKIAAAFNVPVTRFLGSAA